MTGSETVALAKALRTGTDPTIIALAGIASAANTAPYFTDVDTAAVYSLTAAARTVLDDTTVAAMVDTLGGASSTGTGGLARATSPTLVTPALGTPSAAVLTNATGLPLTSGVTGTLPVANGGTGITSLGTGVATFLGTPSSANLAAALTDETGSGAAVFATSPTLVTPALGVATATSVNGTTIPSSKTLVVTTDKLSVHAATSSSELAGVISDETGSGALVFATSPTLVTPLLGTPTSGDLTNCTGFPYVHSGGGGNSGTIASGAPIYFIGASTAGIGIIPAFACHLKRIELTYQVAVSTSSPTLTITLYKNANSGSSSRVFQMTSAPPVVGTGEHKVSTTITDSGADAFNGTTDYFTLVFSSTNNVSLTQVNFRIEGTGD